jgi:hypothetical protein
LTGALVLTSTDGQQFSAAVFTPTAPVYGKRELPTEGLVNHFFQAGSAEKLALIFKMKGATHRWQFVALMQTKDGGVTYELSFYKVNATPEEIRAEMTRLGVAGLPAPAWKAAGTALVKN